MQKKKKKIPGISYETSDTENEDADYRKKSNVPIPPITIELENDEATHDSNDDYVEFHFERLPTSEASPGWSSGAPSIYSSTVSVNQSEIMSKSSAVSRSASDLGFKKNSSKKLSNYDNLSSIWSSLRGKSPDKRNSNSSSPAREKSNRLLEEPTLKPILRRTRSFTLESIQDDSEVSNESKCSTLNNSQRLPNNPKDINDIWIKNEGREHRERPITIAADSVSVYQNFLSIKNNKYSNTVNEHGTANMTPHMSLDNLVNVHPEHKIYSKVNMNKGTIKNVFNKKGNSKQHSSKTISEPSGSVFNFSMDHDLDKTVDKTASKLVCTIARQCSKTLFEKIKQIKTEDIDKLSPTKSSPITEPIYALPIYKQGSSSIGARLAQNSEPSDYAVPKINLPYKKNKSEPLSSSKYSSSSTKKRINKNLKENDYQLVEDINDQANDSPNSIDSDASADSYYERSFEAIENLENEMFRDSAIYSDHDDPDLSPSRPETNNCKLSLPSTILTSSDNQYKGYSSTSLTSSPVNRIKNSSQRENTPLHKTNSASTVTVRTIELNNADSSSSLLNSSSGSNDSSLQNQGKKVPPPVPAKPDPVKLKNSPRMCGSNVMNQLRSLEQCMKSSREELLSEDGQKNTDQSKDNSKSSGSKGSPKSPKSVSPLMTPTPIIKCPINLTPISTFKPATSNRSSSVPPKLSARTQNQNKTSPSSPKSSSNSPRVGNLNYKSNEPSFCERIDNSRDEFEPRMAKGWVRHVVGKLQQSESEV